MLKSYDPLPVGKVLVKFEFEKTAEKQGIGKLYVNGLAQGDLSLKNMWPVIPNAAGIHCGHDDGSPVCEDYEPPFAFTGTISHVDVIIGDNQVIDFMSEYKEAVGND
tara:strand:- start:272 stop:592 length:321 start_codon:yes stop_codon:yes gene_type:complete